jgi:3-hydroxy-9,10-secoandrosta-1,3,5(10)-triene-9,17-dione monooxygenase reductase component
MVAADIFRNVMRRQASTVVVIATRVDRRLHGMTATAFTSVSVDPPLILFCVHRDSGTHNVIRVGSRIGISFLSSGQEAISQRFARKDEKRYSVDDIAFDYSPENLPLMPQACAVMEGTITAQHWGGDHSIFVGHVTWAEPRADRSPLLYHRGNYATVVESDFDRTTELSRQS